MTRMFQSTPPAQGATREAHDTTSMDNVSIHAPRAGGDPGQLTTAATSASFNPRPPRRGRRRFCFRRCQLAEFQSTPPAQGATWIMTIPPGLITVSIHAPPRRGRLPPSLQPRLPEDSFNPRPPRRGRRFRLKPSTTNKTFQSTPPAQGATVVLTTSNASLAFQSTPPAQGATWIFEASPGGFRCFNPRPPRRGRRRNLCNVGRACIVSIHAPRAGGDRCSSTRSPDPRRFNPRPPRRGRHASAGAIAAASMVSIHAPRAGGDNVSTRFNARR